jgi:hypothetical protein
MTDLQNAMISEIARSSFTNVNGDEPQSLSDIGWIWASEVIRTREDKGTFTSLMVAGMVRHQGDGQDATVSLTESGFSAYLSIQN